ncbi:hypothetical protein [Fusobacterium necrophorum]|uniref:hypothetical protein n=1 Tax=Fusobacterium necrophorum TaxID=859 RepID=UPI00370E89A9
MIESINFLKKIIERSVPLRYFALFYLITFFTQILLIRETGRVPSKESYDFLLFLNYTREIVIFIIIMLTIFIIEYCGGILSGILIEIFKYYTLTLIMRKIIVIVILYVSLCKFFPVNFDIHFFEQNFDIFFSIFFLIGFLEMLVYIQDERELYKKARDKKCDISLEKKEISVEFWSRIFIYGIIITKGVFLFYESLK